MGTGDWKVHIWVLLKSCHPLFVLFWFRPWMTAVFPELIIPPWCIKISILNTQAGSSAVWSITQGGGGGALNDKRVRDQCQYVSSQNDKRPTDQCQYISYPLYNNAIQFCSECFSVTTWYDVTQKPSDPANTEHLYNVGPMLVQHCTNFIKMFCALWGTTCYLIFKKSGCFESQCTDV